MNEETKMLRRALEEMQGALSVIWECAREVPMKYVDFAVDANNHASFALRVTSGKLPPDYEIIQPGGRHDKFYVLFNSARIQTAMGKDRFWFDEFKVRVFVWEHHIEQASTPESEREA